MKRFLFLVFFLLSVNVFAWKNDIHCDPKNEQSCAPSKYDRSGNYVGSHDTLTCKGLNLKLLVNQGNQDFTSWASKDFLWAWLRAGAHDEDVQPLKI